MAALPDALRLHEIKYGEKSSDAARIRAADAQFAAGRLAEALDLYQLAGHAEGIDRVRKQALEKGHPSLLLALERRGGTVSAAEWKAAGEAAMRTQRWRDAHRCYRRAGDEEGLAAVREKIPAYEINTPQGK